MASGLQQFTIHAASTVAPQRLVHNGREHLVAPCVMVIEGVLNGGLVPGDEIQACRWDGIPIVINHPRDASGQAISAQQPDVLATMGIGRVFRTQCTTRPLQGQPVTRAHAELWLDTAQAQALGGEALQAIQMLETQQPLEVSTGFYSEAERTAGTFHGVPYGEVHRNLIADHLALLPNSVGACDYARGCGAPRIYTAGQACACQHPEEPKPMDEAPHGWRGILAGLRQFLSRTETELATNATDVDLREALYGALAREMGTDYTPIFIESLQIDDHTFTYRQGERLRQRGWTTSEGGIIELTPDTQDVQRDTTYTPVPTTQEQQEPEEPAMTTPVVTNARTIRINALIEDPGTNWEETDRHFLNEMSEACLIRQEAQPRRQPAVEPPKARTFEEMLAAADPSIRESHEEALENITERKQAAIAVLIANKQCPFDQDELSGMTAKRLESLVQLSGGSVGYDYRGKGLATPRPIPAEPEPEPPSAPATLDRVLDRQRALGLRK